MILAKGILPASIIKRDGASAPFAPDKIRSAIVRAGRATQEFDGSEAESLTAAVLKVLEHRHAAPLTDKALPRHAAQSLLHQWSRPRTSSSRS
ncbi:MAG: ATP cone domain-containing protein, partial [Pseudomonadales bacterium]